MRLPHSLICAVVHWTMHLLFLDEAQNTTPAQMKMFLTRIGFGSKVIITGDSSQKDLPSGQKSGLEMALQVLKKVEGISICQLTSKDVSVTRWYKRLYRPMKPTKRNTRKNRHHRKINDGGETVMSIDFSNEQEQTFDFDFLKVAEDVMETVLDQEGCPYESQVCLVLTDNETIHKTNLEYRQIDRATDVLSFPMVDFPAPADYSVLEDDDSCFDPESGELLLGDIMISAERAAAQAEEYGHSVKREFCFLVAHSMLHLLGYDHMTPEEAADMEARQAKALEELGITR